MFRRFMLTAVAVIQSLIAITAFAFAFGIGDGGEEVPLWLSIAAAMTAWRRRRAKNVAPAA